MRAASRRTFQQSLRLQEGLGPAVAPVEAVMLDQVVIKMPCRETAVAGAIQRLDLLFPVQWHPLAGGFTKTAIQQAGLTAVLKTLTPATECSLAHPQQLRSLLLIEFGRLVTTQHTPKSDHPHTLQRFRTAHQALQRAQNYRTYRVLLTHPTWRLDNVWKICHI
jgi:hypothetical protein